MKSKHILISAAVAGLICSGIGAGALAAGGDTEPLKTQRWIFNGPTGKFSNDKLQRGYQVYKEVCSSCHSMKYLAFRNLSEIGFSEDQVKAIAEEYEVEDGPDDYGDMFVRPARPEDRFPAPFPNDNAARASNNGALPPDLSLITKARAHGPDYVYSLLTGYEDAPADFDVGDLNYNPYFPGRKIAMAAPLFEDAVEYADGTPATVEQMALDVTHFLTWAAEPTLAKRHELGLRVVLFLLVLAGLTYLSNKKVWASIKGKKHG